MNPPSCIGCNVKNSATEIRASLSVILDMTGRKDAAIITYSDSYAKCLIYQSVGTHSKLITKHDKREKDLAGDEQTVSTIMFWTHMKNFCFPCPHVFTSSHCSPGYKWPL